MWSEELQQLTRDHFDNVMKGGLMKHFGDSKFGLCVLEDGKYVIHFMGSKEVCEFTTMDEMLKNGWVLD